MCRVTYVIPQLGLIIACARGSISGVGLISQDLCMIAFGGGLINLLFGWSDSDSEFAGGVKFLVHNEGNIIN